MTSLCCEFYSFDAIIELKNGKAAGSTELIILSFSSSVFATSHGHRARTAGVSWPYSLVMFLKSITESINRWIGTLVGHRMAFQSIKVLAKNEYLQVSICTAV
jgi:hypothetical protein